MNELALFAGSGGGILAGHMLGWRTVCAVEIEDYPRRVLLQRQADGFLPRFPIWDDICTFDGIPWRGKINVISGGFPCQDISSAGKGVGIEGERSGLWKEMFRIICEVGPNFVFVENSPNLTSRGLGTVLGDLASVGFNARWGVLGAGDVGAKHQRDRIWIMAYTNDTDRRRECRRLGSIPKCNIEGNSHSPFNQPEPIRMVDGVASRVDRLKAIGNGQVPICAATAWRILNGL
jgi:DNA (cytosine-5)-methyltransferase 1